MSSGSDMYRKLHTYCHEQVLVRGSRLLIDEDAAVVNTRAPIQVDVPSWCVSKALVAVNGGTLALGIAAYKVKPLCSAAIVCIPLGFQLAKKLYLMYVTHSHKQHINSVIRACNSIQGTKKIVMTFLTYRKKLLGDISESTKCLFEREDHMYLSEAVLSYIKIGEALQVLVAGYMCNYAEDENPYVEYIQMNLPTLAGSLELSFAEKFQCLELLHDALVALISTVLSSIVIYYCDMTKTEHKIQNIEKKLVHAVAEIESAVKTLTEKFTTPIKLQEIVTITRKFNNVDRFNNTVILSIVDLKFAVDLIFHSINQSDENADILQILADLSESVKKASDSANFLLHVIKSRVQSKTETAVNYADDQGIDLVQTRSATEFPTIHYNDPQEIPNEEEYHLFIDPDEPEYIPSNGGENVDYKLVALNQQVMLDELKQKLKDINKQLLDEKEKKKTVKIVGSQKKEKGVQKEVQNLPLQKPATTKSVFPSTSPKRHSIPPNAPPLPGMRENNVAEGGYTLPQQPLNTAAQSMPPVAPPMPTMLFEEIQPGALGNMPHFNAELTKILQDLRQELPDEDVFGDAE